MKEILLTKGYKALVDDEDFDVLNKYKWQAMIRKSGYILARRATYRNGKKVSVSMHKELLSCPKGFEIDHINRNSLDNRKENLRVASRSQNSVNRGKKMGTTSRYIGVFNVKGRKLWQAVVTKDYKVFFKAYFKSELHAAMARDIWAKEAHGEFAECNF